MPLDLERFPELGRALPMGGNAIARLDEQRARVSLAAFIKRLYPPYIDAPYTRMLCGIIEEALETPDSRTIFAMPPRHSKSLHGSEHAPAWFLGRYPDKRVIATAQSTRLALEFSKTAREKVADPRFPFPGIRLKDGSDRQDLWDIAGHEGGYLGLGRESSPVGFGSDLLDIDDPFRSRAEARSALIKEKVWRWYMSQLRTRLQPGGRAMIFATRWAVDDLSGRLLTAGQQGGEVYRYVQLPAIIDEGLPTERALFPEFWSLERLKVLRATMPEEEWVSQYQGAPVAPSGGLLKREWLRYWQFPGLDLRPVEFATAGGGQDAHPVLELPTRYQNVAQSWDMTFDNTANAAFVEGLVLGLAQGNVYILDESRARRDFPDTLDAVLDLSRRYRASAREVLVERKANGPAVMSTLAGVLPGLIPVEPDGSKEARAAAMTPFMRKGGIVLPHPQMRGFEWVNEFVQELVDFPYGAYADRVDALSQGVRHLIDLAIEILPASGSFGQHIAAQWAR